MKMVDFPFAACWRCAAALCVLSLVLGCPAGDTGYQEPGEGGEEGPSSFAEVFSGVWHSQVQGQSAFGSGTVPFDLYYKFMPDGEAFGSYTYQACEAAGCQPLTTGQWSYNRESRELTLTPEGGQASVLVVIFGEDNEMRLLYPVTQPDGSTAYEPVDYVKTSEL
jgi:hypothetical protein